MQVALLPQVVEFVLADHHEWTTEGEGADAKQVKGAPKPDAPVWRFKPLTYKEEMKWRGRLEAAKTPEDRNALVCDLFAERLEGAAPLFVGDAKEPFDKAKHLDAVQIPSDWVDELAGEILLAARISAGTLGK